ncbi:hypothetical protein GCM10027317_09690 [Massilia agri]
MTTGALDMFFVVSGKPGSGKPLFYRYWAGAAPRRRSLPPYLLHFCPIFGKDPTMRITEWPEEQRPRERLLRAGATALSDTELLAIFLRVGVAGKSAVALARDMLEHFGSLHRLLHASSSEFGRLHGLGPAKYAQLQAAIELTRRAVGEEFQRTGLCSPDAVRHYLRNQFALQAHESFVVLFLDVKNRLIRFSEMFRGTLTQLSEYQLRFYTLATREAITQLCI